MNFRKKIIECGIKPKESDPLNVSILKKSTFNNF